MTTGFAIQSVIEIILVAAVIYAVLREKKLIEFEEKIAKRIRARRGEKRTVIIRAEDKFSHCA